MPRESVLSRLGIRSGVNRPHSPIAPLCIVVFVPMSFYSAWNRWIAILNQRSLAGGDLGIRDRGFLSVSRRLSGRHSRPLKCHSGDLTDLFGSRRNDFPRPKSCGESGSTRETKSNSEGQSEVCSMVLVVLRCVQVRSRVPFARPWIGPPGALVYAALLPLPDLLESSSLLFASPLLPTATALFIVMCYLCSRPLPNSLLLLLVVLQASLLVVELLLSSILLASLKLVQLLLEPPPRAQVRCTCSPKVARAYGGRDLAEDGRVVLAATMGMRKNRRVKEKEQGMS
ncbi:hypothetical protein CRG98_006881 [Punica granatum]|uniref:Uncharacterized protein n=1 Tax=Punica granatum TaxID=22663 RepID=A0A2I0KWH7_PUNGR|nr:hypothetical protein CRG98_006881 [Punica granatum]